MSESDLSRSDGQAMVEFALALPVVLLLIFGVLQFGRAFQIKIVLENAAREGAHFFIYDKDDADDGFPNTILAVQNEANSGNSGVTIEDGDISVQCWNGASLTGDVCLTGYTVEVIVTHEYEVSVFSYFFGPIPMKSNARMLVP